MRKIRASNEDEMIYGFLKMEIASERYSEKIEMLLGELGIDRRIITNGDLTDEKENALRAELLGCFRGFGKNRGLFENFPANIDWVWTVFDKADIGKILYINYSYWNELSDYTGSPFEAAKSILAGKVVYGVSNNGSREGAKKLKQGHKFPPLIMLTDENENRYIILEGHGRMTAYGLVPETFENVSVLLGYCDSGELDKWYGEMPERAL